jgi:hypothetical protein
MTTGILTLALKHPLYGRFAYNLALSIKSADPKQRVAVIADDAALAHLHEGQRMVFDKIIKPKPESVKDKPLTAKFYLNSLSPYDRTLFVDADMVFSPMCNFAQLWQEMDGVEWTMANRGVNDPDKGISEWVDPGKLAEAYGKVSQWIDLSSEWIYWVKGELADSIFVGARNFYKENKLHTRQFAGDKPDEPFFNLALAAVQHQPHKMPWQPTYWQPAIRKVLSAMEIKRQYYAFSAGGNHLPPQQFRIYQEFMKNASFRMNMPALTIANKRSQLKERTHI